MTDKKKNIIHWVVGLLLINLGVALCTRANFGLSMIGAPPYILHVWLRDAYPWFTQGTAEYFCEFVVMAVTCLVIRRFKPGYLLSVGTGVISGLLIDGFLYLLGGNSPYESLYLRMGAFVAGMLFTSLGIAFVFRTSMPKAVYEMAVAEISDRFGFKINKVKQIFDYSMLAVALILAFTLTHKLTGIGQGTLIITFANAPLIKLFGKYIDKLKI